MSTTIQVTDFEKYLITQAIEAYKEQLQKMEFNPRSIVTREYVESFLVSIQEKVK